MLEYIKKRTNKTQKTWFRKNIVPPLSFIFSNNLKILASLHRTDKATRHSYIQHYEQHFRGCRRNKMNVLEIGVGGYEIEGVGGNSLRMWKAYFPRSIICGLDLHDKREFEEHRVKIFQGDQSDSVILEEIVKELGGIDIVIDDGSHINSHVISSFNALFPLLSSEGIYVIEDLQTAYWPKFGGKKTLDDPTITSIDFLKERVDGLNYSEFSFFDYDSSYLDKNIKSVHFYHNLCFIHKGKNPS